MKLFIAAILLAHALPASASELEPVKAPAFRVKHPVWHKMWAPVRWTWKPVKKVSDVTRLTKVVVLVDDLAKASSKKLEPYNGLVGAGGSLYGIGVNSGAVFARGK